MKVLWARLLASVTVLAQSQTVPKPADAAQPHQSIAEFGLVYPLSNDWVRATEMLRRRVESDSTRNYDVLLAAIYVPKSEISSSSPFFSLMGYRPPGANCKKSLEAMIANSQDEKGKPEGGVIEFSAAGREYFRVNIAHVSGHHACIICTAANGHLLIWNASAANEKGLDAIVATLDSITPVPPPSTAESAQPPTPKKDDEAETGQPQPKIARPTRVRVSSGVSQGLLIRKVNPEYPPDARAAHIQGTVILQAVISKTGDITDLELVDGPIELAGSAVAAARQWKYKPYLLMGQPVVVVTQIQVNYQLGP